MELQVGDVMVRGVICADASESVQSAAEIMREHDISSLIVTEEGDGVGMVTDRDIIRQIVAEGKDPEHTPVKDIMTYPLITIAADTDVDDAARIMRDRNWARPWDRSTVTTVCGPTG